MRIEAGAHHPRTEDGPTSPTGPGHRMYRDPEPIQTTSADDEGGFFDALGDFFSGVGDVVGAVAEGAVDAVFGVGSAIGGVFTDPSEVPEELVENLTGVGLLVAGRATSAVQMLIGVEAPGRRLAPDEVTAMRRIFGDSIDYNRVVIKEGDAGLFSANGRPFAHGNVVYVKTEEPSLTLLAHELVHVWQYQNGGPDNMAEALFAQAFGDAYDWRKAIAEGKSWDQMDPEQQGEFIMAAYNSGFFAPGELEGNQRFVLDGVDYTPQLRAALQQIRAGQGAP